MNKEFSCRTCPKGFFTNVSSDQCEHCQTGTYTESENCLLKCRRCRSICRDNKFESVPCTATSNRQCSCKSSFYCKQKNEKNCEECAPCGQQDEEINCKGCPPGSFYNNSLSENRCQPHTNCTVIGKLLKTHGNHMADNLCEDFPITVYPVRNEFQHKTQENSWNHITWIVATVCIVFAVALVKSAICGNLKQQGVMLKNAIKNICFCGPSIFMLINRKSTTRKDEEYPLGVPEQCSPDEKPSSLHSSVGIHVQLTMTQSQDKTLEYIKDTTLECQDDTTLVYNSRTTVDYNSKTVTWEADSTTVNSQKEDDIPFPVQEAVKDKTTSWLTVIDTEKCPEPSSDEVPTAYWIPV